MAPNQKHRCRDCTAFKKLVLRNWKYYCPRTDVEMTLYDFLAPDGGTYCDFFRQSKRPFKVEEP